MSHKDNHGQVGEALKIKLRLDTFNNTFQNALLVADKTELSVEELSEKFNISALVPFIIDKDTQGDYDVICEHGVEVRYFND